VNIHHCTYIHVSVFFRAKVEINLSNFHLFIDVPNMYVRILNSGQVPEIYFAVSACLIYSRDPKFEGIFSWYDMPYCVSENCDFHM
jgi:hypothetical protein